MQLGLFDILLILGIVQGVLLSIILFTHKSNQQANRLLGGAMFFLSLEIFYLFISKNNFIEYLALFIPLFFSLPFIYSPMLFLYVKELTSDKGCRRIDLLHFIPFFISLLSIFVLSLESVFPVKTFLMKINEGNLEFTSAVNNFKPVYAVGYIFYMLIYIKRHNRRLENSFSYLDKINLNWLRNFSVAMIVLAAITAAQNISEFIYEEKSILEIYLFISIVILIYLIGYFGLKQPEIFSQVDKEDTSKIKSPVKYQKSGLDEKSAEGSLNTLLSYMEKEKPYLKGDLTLHELAGGCGISVHHLSEIINTKLKQSYYDFVNKYRVEEFKRKLNEQENTKFTILSIAFDCGFNSKSSFNTVFKKYTGSTPSEYRKSVL